MDFQASLGGTKETTTTVTGGGDPVPPTESPNYIDIVCNDYTITSGLKYAAGYDDSLLMDVWEEQCNTNTNRPAAIILHPSGQTSSGYTMQKYGVYFVKRGYKVFAVEYGDFGGGQFTNANQKAALRNVAAAKRHIAGNASLYGVNKNWVFPVGESAGGLTAAALATCGKWLDISNPNSASYDTNSPFYSTFFGSSDVNKVFPDESSEPAMCGSVAGAISPIFTTFMRNTMKSILFYNGLCDRTFYPTSAEINYEAMEELGVFALVKYFADITHNNYKNVLDEIMLSEDMSFQRLGSYSVDYCPVPPHTSSVPITGDVVETEVAIGMLRQFAALIGS